MLLFSELRADAALADKTGFAEGTPLYYVRRLHYLNEQPLIMNPQATSGRMWHAG